MKESIITLLTLIWKRKYFVLLFGVLGCVLMFWQVWQSPELYKITRTLTVSHFPLESTNKESAENEIALRLYSQIEGNEDSISIKNLIETNNLFKEERENGKSLDSLAQKIASGIEIDNVTTSEDSVKSFDLSYISSDRDNAEEVVSALLKLISDTRIEEQNQNKIKVLSYCCHQTKVVAPKRWLMLTFGLFAGLTLGILFAVLPGKLQ